ncbi:hypothetical protein ACPXCS_17930 [Streptomyces sp. DT190]|uniref:hypothetical protein n=1 Tax=unclassified Streptomyces TaxID=2593676 RepID=UPI003CF33FA0
MPEDAQHRHIDRAEQLRNAARVTGREAAQEGDRQALFFEGPENIGKTSLLFEIYRRHRSDGAYYVDLEDTSQEGEVLEALAAQAQWQGVGSPSYRTTRDRIVQQSRSAQISLHNVRARQSTIQLLSASKDRLLETASMSDAVLDDLVGGVRRPVICLDGFEVCAGPMRNWLGRHLLPKLLSRREVSVFVAGRELPRVPSAFAEAVHTLVLPPFDVAAVEEWIEELGLDDLRDSAVSIYSRYGGVPGLLAEFFRQHADKRGDPPEGQEGSRITNRDSRDG